MAAEIFLKCANLPGNTVYKTYNFNEFESRYKVDFELN